MAGAFAYNEAKTAIQKRVSTRAYRDMLRYLNNRNVKWWAKDKPHDLTEVVLVATCIKDVLGCSYNDIRDILKQKMLMFPRALQRNVKLARHHLANWARQYIGGRTRREVNEAANRAGLPVWLSSIKYWINSTDVRIAKKGKKRNAKSNHWSTKLGGPGRRFSLVCDADLVISRHWSGYSPKVYDGDFAVTHQDTLRELAGDGAIVGDNHYWAAGKKVHDLKIIASPTKKTTIQEARTARFATTAGELKLRRREVKEARGRIEGVFSSIKKDFRSLRGEKYMPWRENLKELDHTFTWACGVHNFKKRRYIPDDE